MRVYMDERLIVSTRQRKVLALDDVVSDLEEGTGPEDCGGWLVDVCDALTDHASEFIEQLHDKIIDWKIICSISKFLRVDFWHCCVNN